MRTAATFLLAALLGASPAAASTASVGGAGEAIVSGDAAANHVVLVREGNSLVVDDSAGIVAGAGCAQAAAFEVICALVSTASVDLGPGDDSVLSSYGPERLDGGPGTDTVEYS